MSILEHRLRELAAGKSDDRGVAEQAADTLCELGGRVTVSELNLQRMRNALTEIKEMTMLRKTPHDSLFLANHVILSVGEMASAALKSAPTNEVWKPERKSDV